jgi:hypothetical protein
LDTDAKPARDLTAVFAAARRTDDRHFHACKARIAQAPRPAESPGEGPGLGITLRRRRPSSSPRLGAFEEPTLSVRCSPFMSLRADMYRQRAADATKRAAQAKDLSVRKAFEEVARGWRVLAEQMEWIDRHRSTLPDEENDRSSC